MNLIILVQTDFISESRVCLAGRRATHIRDVCRPSIGDTLRVGVLNGMLGSGVVVELTKDRIVLDVLLDSPAPHPLEVVLIIALPRPKSLKKVVETATAMGVKRIVILESWRVEKSYWTSPVVSEKGLHDSMILGLEQAKDTVLPSIDVRRRFKPFVQDELPAIVKESGAGFVAHPYASRMCPGEVGREFTLALGPEGGFIPYEIEELQRAGLSPVSIGGRTLRVETAVAALLGRMCTLT